MLTLESEKSYLFALPNLFFLFTSPPPPNSQQLTLYIMKKTILFLGLLGLTVGAQAQTTPNLGPWVQVNTTNYQTFAPGFRVSHITTASPTISWATVGESPSGNDNSFLVTNNAAGTQFDYGSISAAGANPSFETANISPVGVSATTAVAGNYGSAGGGEILRTTNAGISWTKVATFANASSFLDFIHMFNNLEGVAVGDPTNGYFEIWRTTDGGVTWTRLPQTSMPPLLNANEYGLVHSYFALGNTIWFGGASSNDSDPVRVWKSTDKGLTWTAGAVTPLTGTISRLAFKDAQNGIAFNVKTSGTAPNVVVTSVNLIRTSDGGATWTSITPNQTATGSFFRYDIDAVNGKYYSVGQRFPAASPAVAADFGSSYSTDGVNWTNMNNSQGFFAFDLVPNGTSDATGYAGASSDAQGVGGIYKAATTVLGTRDAALQGALSVYPNPSASGIFTVDLGSSLKGQATLLVADALGRQIKTQELNATSVGSKNFTLDLSGEKAGVYTLQIRTAAGMATQKLVVE